MASKKAKKKGAGKVKFDATSFNFGQNIERKRRVNTRKGNRFASAGGS